MDGSSPTESQVAPFHNETGSERGPLTKPGFQFFPHDLRHLPCPYPGWRQLPRAQTKSSIWRKAFLRPHIQLGLRVCFSVHVDFGRHRPSCSRLWICVNDFPDKGGKSVERWAPSPWSLDEDGGGVGRQLGSVLGCVPLLGPASRAGAGPGPSAAPLADFGAPCLPLRLQGAVCLWSLGHPLSLHPDRETTTTPWSSRHGPTVLGYNCEDRESVPLAGCGRWKLGRGGEESRGKLMKCPDLKLLSSPPLWGLRFQRWWGCWRAAAPSTALGVHAEPGGAPRSGGRCARGPRLPRVGAPEPQTWRKRSDRHTKKRRKATAGGNANASPTLLPFTSKGNQRQTDTQTALH